MCENEKILSCEISYLPLDNNTNEYIDQILDLIKNSGIEHTIGPFRTKLTGSIDPIMNLVKHLYIKADSLSNFVIDIRFSNICGI